MNKETPDHKKQINTEGGSTLSGHVEIAKGDLIGRDKNVHGDEIQGDKVLGNKIEIGFLKIPRYWFIFAIISLIVMTSVAISIVILLGQGNHQRGNLFDAITASTSTPTSTATTIPTPQSMMLATPPTTTAIQIIDKITPTLDMPVVATTTLTSAISQSEFIIDSP